MLLAILKFSGADFQVSPSSIVADVNTSPVVFEISFSNAGKIPILVSLLMNASQFLTRTCSCLYLVIYYLDNLTANYTTLSAGECVYVQFTYSGPIPFLSSVSFIATDAVTEFHLCFNSQKNVPISLSKSIFFFFRSTYL